MANMALKNMAKNTYLRYMNLSHLYQTSIYKSWANMKTRCNNPKSTNYHRYGGRGITLCDSWKTFAGFYKDMGGTFQEGFSLDRINNDGNYCLENCKWSTPTQQANNRHTNKFIDFNGKSQTIEKWIKELGLKSSTVRQRYYVYKMPIDRCFTSGRLEIIKNV
jgi:carboxypeptidase C (cathepsin A)